MDRVPVFSAEWDDRCADLRNDAAALAAMRADPATRVLPLWRGRPLVAGEGRGQAGWLDPGHPMLRDADPDWIFLGRHAGVARFAADLAHWTPEALDDGAMLAFLDPNEYPHPAVPGDHVFAELRGLLTRLDPVDAAMAATARGLFNWHGSHRFCSACGQPSAVTQAGWQRRCGACNASHFPRTDPVVIMLVLNGNRALLGRSPGWPQGMYSALAGFVEPGEAPEAAVKREVFEETGIRAHTVRYVAAQPWPFPNSLMLGFVAHTDDHTIVLDNELDDARWVTREEMVTIMAGAHPVMRKPRAGAIAHDLVSLWLSDGF